MADSHFISALDDEGLRRLCAVIEAAWPGVQVKTLELYLDNRRRGSIGERYGGRLSIRIVLAGEAAALVRHGVLQQSELDSLPPCGIRPNLGWAIRRGKRAVRVDAYIVDPVEEDDKDRKGCHWRRLWDRLAPIISASVWTPPQVSA